MDVTIRRAETAADFEAFRALLVEYEASLPLELQHGFVPTTNALKASYAQRNAAALVAWIGQSASGCVAVTGLDARTAMLLRLYVKPNSRGRGIARELVNSGLAFLQERRFDAVVLDTDKNHLSAAYKLYLSLGFTECAAQWTVDYQCPTFMKRRLTAEG